MNKRSKKENELLNYLSEDERKVYQEFILQLFSCFCIFRLEF